MKKLVYLVLFVLLGFNAVYAQNNDHIQLIRNATLSIKYAGHKILVDPMFSPKAGLVSIAGKEISPLVDLPMPSNEILKNVELLMLTHNHIDHFDPSAIKLLDKNMKVISQPADRDTLENLGFKNIETVQNSYQWNDIEVIRTIAQHGTGRVLDLMGKVSGYILKAKNHPTIYIVGDAVWTEDIYNNIKKYQPDYILVNSGGAKMPSYEATPIIMDAQQTVSLIQESGKAKVIAIHMDAIDHCYTTREVLKHELKKYSFDSGKVLIPADGERIDL